MSSSAIAMEDDLSSVFHDRQRKPSDLKSSEREGKMQKKKKDDDCWWSIAFLTRTTADSSSVTVSLIDLDDGKRALPRAATLSSELAPGMSFALLESKLYAFGCHVINESSSDFYVCDLKGSDYNPNLSYEFRPQGKLKTPKPRPIVVPYDNKKIFIIATGPSDPSSDLAESVRPPFCEVLKLPSLEPQGIKTPFDKAYATRRPYTPWSDAHVVQQGHKLYVQIVADIWQFQPRIFCLDMATEKWYFCHDVNFESCGEAGDDEDAAYRYRRLEPMPSFMHSLYLRNHWRYANYVVGNIMFVAGVAAYGQLRPEGGSIFVRAIHVNDIASPVCRDTTYFPPLEAVEARLSKLFPYADPDLSSPGWVVPCDLHDGVFCLFMSINGQLLACKFQLLGENKVPLEEDDPHYFWDDHSYTGYHCKVLSDQFLETGRVPGPPLYAFTRQGYRRFGFTDV